MAHVNSVAVCRLCSLLVIGVLGCSTPIAPEAAPAGPVLTVSQRTAAIEAELGEGIVTDRIVTIEKAYEQDTTSWTVPVDDEKVLDGLVKRFSLNQEERGGRDRHAPGEGQAGPAERGRRRVSGEREGVREIPEIPEGDGQRQEAEGTVDPRVGPPQEDRQPQHQVSQRREQARFELEAAHEGPAGSSHTRRPHSTGVVNPPRHPSGQAVQRPLFDLFSARS